MACPSDPPGELPCAWHLQIALRTLVRSVQIPHALSDSPRTPNGTLVSITVMLGANADDDGEIFCGRGKPTPSKARPLQAPVRKAAPAPVKPAPKPASASKYRTPMSAPPVPEGGRMLSHQVPDDSECSTILGERFCHLYAHDTEYFVFRADTWRLAEIYAGVHAVRSALWLAYRGAEAQGLSLTPHRTCLLHV
jgi:hypothetical protein